MIINNNVSISVKIIEQKTTTLIAVTFKFVYLIGLVE